VYTVDVNAKIKDALKMLREHNFGALVVTENNVPEGILTEKDFLRKAVLKNEFYTRPVSEIYTNFMITVGPKQSIFTAQEVMRETNIRKLVVMARGNMQGIITQTDLVTAWHKFTGKTFISSNDMLIVNDIMGKSVVKIDKYEPFAKAREVMARLDIGCLVVTNQGKPEGIVTQRDFVDELYKNIEKINKFSVAHVMRSPFVSVTPDRSIFEANSRMIEKGFRRLPVMQGNMLKGIITQTDICKNIFQYMLALEQLIIKKGIVKIDVEKVEEESEEEKSPFMTS